MPARIVSDPNIMLGKPVIDGTRITVQLILERLAAGASVADIVDAYPHLDVAQVRAALAYAASLLRSEIVSREREGLAEPRKEELRAAIAKGIAELDAELGEPFTPRTACRTQGRRAPSEAGLVVAA